AIGAGNPTDCAAAPVNGLDQRGDPRNAATRGTCDIGAYDTGGRAFSQTAITSVTAHPQVGQRIVVKVAVTNLAGATGPAPSGRVTVSDGTQVCRASLTTGSAGSATGRCALVESAPGSYSLTASYPGDAAYQASATPAATPVTVAKARTTTTLTLSTGSVVYGHEQSEVFTVTVRPAFAGTPTGSVVVKSGTKRLCTVTLSGGSGTCSPFAKALPAGADPVVARYTGSTDFRPSTSASATLTVSP
ncbi:MAG: Ig-like domain repeat protein, partial [Acidimicrobiales bacterium]